VPVLQHVIAVSIWTHVVVTVAVGVSFTTWERLDELLGRTGVKLLYLMDERARLLLSCDLFWPVGEFDEFICFMIAGCLSCLSGGVPGASGFLWWVL